MAVLKLDAEVQLLVQIVLTSLCKAKLQWLEVQLEMGLAPNPKQTNPSKLAALPLVAPSKTPSQPPPTKNSNPKPLEQGDTRAHSHPESLDLVAGPINLLHEHATNQMTAATVASSSPMSSPFGQANQSTSSPAPAFNPFASKPQGQKNPFAAAAAAAPGAGATGFQAFDKQTPAASNHGDAEGTKKPANPFQSNGGNVQGKRRSQSPFGAGNGNLSDSSKASSGRNNVGGKGHPGNKPFGQPQDGNNPFAANKARQTNGSKSPFEASKSPSPAPFAQTQTQPPSSGPDISHLTDPHAKKVYSQLHNDGISPPQWPSRPGDPQSKGEMARFREKYDTYRDKVRASLTKAGLIDDPEKRKALRDAIDFRGICEDMCPEYEKITRITEFDVPQSERDPKTTAPSPARMTKKLARSAAGQEAPLPMDVRSVACLRRTFDYLIDDLLKIDGNLPVLHGYLWDRTRAIRRDFTFFSSLSPEELKMQVYVLENIARFHVTALHLLSEEGKAPEDFVEQQELEQLGKCLLSLRDLYDDCGEQGITCENEAEFRAFYLIFHANDPNILEILQRQWKSKFWKESDLIRTAVSLVEALRNTQDFHGPLKVAPSLAASTAHHSYFRIVESDSVSYTMACFAECHFPQLRRSILRSVKSALTRPKAASKDVTARDLNKFLRFDTVEEAIRFARLHDLEFAPDEQSPHDLSSQHLILDNRTPLPHPRLQHQFSHTFVESKRQARPFPELIHQTVFASASRAKAPEVRGEESLFVSESKPAPEAPASSSKQGAPAFIQTPSSPAASSSGFDKAATPSNKPALPPSFAPSAPSPGPSTTPFANPFSSASPKAPSPISSKPSPFGSSTPSNLQPLPKDLGLGSSQPSTTLDFLKPAVQTHKSQQSPLLSGQQSSNTPNASTSPFAPSASAGEKSYTPASNQASNAPLNQPSFTPTFTAMGSASLPKPTQDSPSARPSPNPFNSIASDKPSASVFAPTQPQGTSSFPKASMPPFSETASGSKQGLAPPFPSSQSGKEPSGQPSLQPAAPLVSQPSRPRDRMGDFTKWIVQGDGGLMDEFQIYMLEDILKGVYDNYVTTRNEEVRLEEEERNETLADEFRVYNISLKFFYRWKHQARQKRLKALRRSGREQARAYHEAQRASELKLQKDAARQAARQKSRLSDVNRHEEFKEMLSQKKRKPSFGQAEDAIVASGVLSGLDNERHAAAAIVRDGAGTPARGRSSMARQHVAANNMLPPRSPSASSTSGGSKSRALREQFFANESTGFRRSMPPRASSERRSSSQSRGSKVSERWRLKAMGIVQLPDGTAVPESLAKDTRYNTKSYSSLNSSYYGSNPRRSSVTSAIPSRRHSLLRQDIPGTSADGETSNNKRKRTSDDLEDARMRNETGSHSHKRVMSDAENLLQELKSMREEMQESTSWFRTQNERLQSEIESRGSTPWEGGS